MMMIEVTPFRAALLVLAFTAFVSTSGHANSRFTVTNNSDNRIGISIFNGDDKICLAPKSKQVKGGESASFGCAGGGKHRCKVSLEVRNSGGEFNETICKDISKSCGIIVPNGGEIIIGSDDACTLVTP